MPRQYLRVDLATVRCGLSADAEVSVLGFVHAYLAHWMARSSEGTAPPPPGWPDGTYEYTGTRLRIPVLAAERTQVAQTIRTLLERSRSES